MIRTWCAAMLLTVALRSIGAQDPVSGAAASARQDGMIRGRITAQITGEGLSRAVITIEGLGLQQFSNDQGRFYFVKVKPGAYRLSIRQLGYLPASVAVVVDSTGAAETNVQLERIAIRLSEFRVTERQPCQTPGRPTQADGKQLVEMFEQLEQSAVRLGLLATQYPYEMQVQRQMYARRRYGREVRVSSDMLKKKGQQTAAYEPGRVVSRVEGSDNYSFEIPSLFDFADGTFIANHCFTLAGYETLASETGKKKNETFVRIDIVAADALSGVDVEGSVYLDSADFRLRRSEMRLTNVPQHLSRVTSVRATTTFDDVVPGLPVINRVQAVTEMKVIQGLPSQVEARREQQVVTKIVFTGQRPDAVKPPPC